MFDVKPLLTTVPSSSAAVADVVDYDIKPELDHADSEMALRRKALKTPIRMQKSSRKPRINDKQVTILICPLGGCGIRFQSCRGLKSHVRQMHSDQLASTSQSNTENALPEPVSVEINDDRETTRKSRRFNKDYAAEDAAEDGRDVADEDAQPRRHKVRQNKSTRLDLIELKCAKCSFTTMIRALLVAHKVVHAGERPHECTVAECGKAYTSAHALARHARVHTGEKPFKCDVCEFASAQNEALVRHRQNIHNVNYLTLPKLECSSCSYTTYDGRNFAVHARRHTGERPYKCSLCDKSFSQNVQLSRHQHVHTGERAFKCSQCDYAGIRASDLAHHRLTHTNEKAFKCDECGIAFRRKRNLTVHSRTHMKNGGERRFACTQCALTFYYRSELHNHMPTHTGERAHVCAVCSRSYARAKTLTVHMRTHTGERPYECTQCDYTTVSSGALARHMKTHTGEQAFECVVCAFTCAKKIALTRHLRNVHPGAIKWTTTPDVEVQKAKEEKGEQEEENGIIMEDVVVD